MAVLAGFGWTIGFILFVLPDNQEGFKRFLVATVKYLFILLNATPGLFIFGVYVCNRRVLSLYHQLLMQIYQFFQLKLTAIKEFMANSVQNCLYRTKWSLAKLGTVKKKQKEKTEVTSMAILDVSMSGKSLESSNHANMTYLLSKNRDQSLPVYSKHEALSSSSEKP